MDEQFGPYELIRKVAQGGMAEVFLARHQGKIGGFSKQLAIKRIYPHLASDPELISMFIDEARIAARLNHPNIVQIYDLGEIDEYFYIAMEFVNGCDLRSLCERSLGMDNFLPIHLACRIVADAASGLHYAHTRLDEGGSPMNIVHRDISPQNILIGMNGNVKLCDFGIAKAEERLTHTRTGQFKGKFAYMSPEQVMGGEAPLDARSDLFSLGIVLYEITTVSRLFRGKNDYETIRLVGEMEIIPPSEVVPGFSPSLEQIILKALERDPNTRFQSAQAFQLALEEWLVEERAKATSLHVAKFMQDVLPEEMNSETSAMLSLPTNIRQQVDALGGEPTETIEDDEHVDQLTQQSIQTPDAIREAAMSDEEYDRVDATTDIDMASMRQALIKDTYDEKSTGQTYPGPQSHTPAPRDRNMTPMGHHHVAAQTLSTQTAQANQASAQVAQPAQQLAGPPVVQATTQPAPQLQMTPQAAPQAQLAQPTGPQPVLEPSVPLQRQPQVSGQHPSMRRPQLSGQHPAMARPPRPTGPHERPARPSGVHAALERSEQQVQAAQQQPQPEPHHEQQPEPAPVDADSMASMEFDMGALQRKDRNKKLAMAFVGLLLAVVVVGVVVKLSSEQQVPQPKTTPKLTADQLKLPPPKPLPRQKVALTSQPEGALLVLNGRLTNQTTPATLDMVEGQLNEVLFYKSGYLSHRILLRPKANQAELKVVLDEADKPDPKATPTSLVIESQPAGAQIIHNGVKIGQTPHRIEVIDPSQEHYFALSKEGHFSYMTLTRLTSEKENKLVAELPSKTLKSFEDKVDVIFDIIPKDSVISINGEKKGLSKTSLKLRRGTFAQLKFEQKNYEPMERGLELDGFGVFVYHPFLTAIVRKKTRLTASVDAQIEQIYIGNQSYRPDQLKRLEMYTGNYSVVVETGSGTRMSGKLSLKDKKLNRLSFSIENGALTIKTK